MGNQQTNSLTLTADELKEWEKKMADIVNAPPNVIPMPKYEHMHEIMDGLFLGNIESAKNVELLRVFQISYVVNCAASGAFTKTGKDYYEQRDYPIEFLGIEAEDMDEYDMISHAPQVISFIDKAYEAKKEKGCNILIHCQAGINRSTTMVVCYLISRHRKGLLDATRLCREKRGLVLWNPSFRAQLVKYAHQEGLLQ